MGPVPLNSGVSTISHNILGYDAITTQFYGIYA